MEENEKNTSIWSVLFSILGFLFGAFLVYKAVSKKKAQKKKRKKKKERLPLKQLKMK